MERRKFIRLLPAAAMGFSFKSQNTPRTEPLLPLFPLDLVLLPQTNLPLHIFEERYKAMTGDALSGDRQIAMALLAPGWEKNYHGIAAVEPVCCVGTILTWEELADGTFNLLLQGHTRARIIREHRHGPYRVGELAPLVETERLAEPETGSDEWKAWNRVWRMPPGKDRGKERSRFFPGMASAMARQWGAQALADIRRAA